jgi:hypothetical protein
MTDETTNVRNPLSHRSLRTAMILAMVIAIGGCASYTTPGRAADFRAMGITPEQADAMTDSAMLERLQRKPLAGFPTSIAVARVQDRGYRAYQTKSYGEGRYSIVTTRDVESDDSFDRLAKLPLVAGLAPINRLVIPSRLDSERDLRTAAASVQADMLLIYTFDTQFGSESKIAPLATFTLGLFPEREARVTSTASAALLDTRNGYVYGLAEGTSHTTQLANAWTSETAVEESRRRAEREAFDKLVAGLETMWQGVVARYGPPPPDGATAGVAAAAR